MARWQIVVGPATQGPVAELVSASSRRIVWRLSEPSTLNFTLPGRDPQTGFIAELATDVHLLIDGVPWFTGRVGGTVDEISDDRHVVSVAAADTRALLGRRLWPDPLWGNSENPTGRRFVGDAGALARLLVDTAQAADGGDLGITTTTVPDIGVAVDRTIESGSPILANLDALAATAGFDWDISPGWTGRELQLWTPRGVDRGVVLDYTSTPGQPRSSIIARVSRQVDPAMVATAVVVLGGVRVEHQTMQITTTDDEGNPVTELVSYEVRIPTHPEYRSVAPGAAEGLWESRVVEAAYTTQGEVAARADAEAAKLGQVTPTYEITLQDHAWGGPSHIWLGDTVRVWLRSGRLSEDLQLRVTEIDLTLGESGEESVTLTLGTPRATLLREIHAMSRRLITASRAA